MNSNPHFHKSLFPDFIFRNRNYSTIFNIPLQQWEMSSKGCWTNRECNQVMFPAINQLFWHNHWHLLSSSSSSSLSPSPFVVVFFARRCFFTTFWYIFWNCSVSVTISKVKIWREQIMSNDNELMNYKNGCSGVYFLVDLAFFT